MQSFPGLKNWDDFLAALSWDETSAPSLRLKRVTDAPRWLVASMPALNGQSLNAHRFWR
jgi:hypothetical protein